MYKYIRIRKLLQNYTHTHVWNLEPTNELLMHTHDSLTIIVIGQLEVTIFVQLDLLEHIKKS